MAQVTAARVAGLWLATLVVAAVPAAAQRAPTPQRVAPTIPVPPSVRAGVDLWRAGDWAGAVAIWQPFANAGDADAMFNLGQAYKLGRAVPVDKAVARDWYRRSALKNHLPAQANLGILLFQAGEKAEAARWLKSAADRGEMRAQYVLGVAHWNGDGTARSLPLAYAYLSRASAQGLAEATSALGNLSRTISAAERTSGQTIAASLAAGTGIPVMLAAAAAPSSITTAELNRLNAEAVQKPPAPVRAPIVAEAPTVARTPAPVVAPPIAASPPVAPPPVVAPAVVAPKVQPAASPPNPAAPLDRPAAPVVKTVAIVASEPIAPPAAPPLAKAEQPAAKSVEKLKPAGKAKVAEKPVEPAPGWRVQLGAFGKKAQAEAAWAEIMAKQKVAVGKAKPIYAPGTSIIKLQMGPYKTRDLAKEACAKIAFGGRACFVTEG